MLTKVLRSSPLALLAASFVACGEAPAPQNEVQFLGQPIINGSAPDDARYDAVVGFYIYKSTATYICSGTLIAPNIVLTAAHCLDIANGGRSYQTAAPNQIEVFFDDTIQGPGTGFIATETLIHSGYNRRSFGVNDLGLIRLAGTSTTITPIPILPAAMSGLETVGTSVNFAGYGRTETNSLGTLLQVDGTLSAIRPTQLEYQQALSEGGPCNGDSGGPLFYDFGGSWYVGGTTSYGDSQCASYGVSMRVTAYETWITDFIGTMCTTNAECDDGNTCTDDSCDPGLGCQNTNNSNACDDGDACTNNDICAGGTCGGTLICEPPPPPACFPKGDSCSAAADCCSGKCRAGICR